MNSVCDPWLGVEQLDNRVGIIVVAIGAAAADVQACEEAQRMPVVAVV